MTMEDGTKELGNHAMNRRAIRTQCRGPMPLRRGAVLVAVLAILAGLVAAAGYRSDAAAGTGNLARAGSAREWPVPTRAERIKAAFLYNFAKFTEWPEEAFPSSNAPIKLCAFGTKGLHSALRTMQGKKIQNRLLTSRHPASAEEFGECHLLFFGAAVEPQLKKILEDMNHKPILTVSELPSFTRLGGIIRLKTVKGKFRIEINQTAAQQVGLRFSSKLLRLSNVVRINNMVGNE